MKTFLRKIINIINKPMFDAIKEFVYTYNQLIDTYNQYLDNKK